MTDEDPMPGVARNDDAVENLLDSYKQTIREIEDRMLRLSTETQLFFRNYRVEGDRWYHPQVRSYPVEKAMRNAVNDLDRVVKDLSKVVEKRRTYRAKVENLPAERRAKALAKGKNPPALQKGTSGTDAGRETKPQGAAYTGEEPNDISDLRRSA